MTTPTVSVIIPTYNRERLIGRAIDSVRSQTYEDWECLVVDDGSTDRTEAVVSEINDPRVRYIRRPNGGANAARNTGIANARGHYIGFLDSDDEWLPNFLALQLATLRERADAALAYCWATFFFDDYVYDRVARHEGRDFYLGVLGGTFTPITSQWLCRSDALRSIGGFDESMPSHQDRELCVRLSARFPVTYTPVILVYAHNSTAWHHVSTAQGAMARAMGLFWERHRDRLEAEGMVASFLLRAARGLIFVRNDARGGRALAARLIQAAPLCWHGYATYALSFAPLALRRQVPGVIRTARTLLGREAAPSWISLRRVEP